MHKFLLVIALSFSSVVFSQDTANEHIRWEDTSATKKILDDTQRFIDSVNNARTYNDMTQGLNNLMQYQKEQRAKKKRQAYLYIGLGVFFFAILVVGLRRRVKK